MSDQAAKLRQLKIKTGVVKRVLKDHNSYKNEATEQKIKADKLVADGAEEWHQKNGQKMLVESQKMLDDASERLGKAVGELRDLVVAVRGDASVNESDEFKEAEGVLEIANT